MKSKHIKKRNEKLILELTFLYVDLEYHEDLYKDIQQEFKDSFYEEANKMNLGLKREQPLVKEEDGCTDIGTAATETSETSETSETQTTQSAQRGSDEFSKLYRKIVPLTHPDLHDKNDSEAIKKKKLDMFIKATKAVKDKSWYTLCKIALDLGIELPEPTTQQINWLEEEIANIKKRIQFITTTYAWLWYHTPHNQQNIMHDYFRVVKIAK